MKMVYLADWDYTYRKAQEGDSMDWNRLDYFLRASASNSLLVWGSTSICPVYIDDHKFDCIKKFNPDIIVVIEGSIPHRSIFYDAFFRTFAGKIPIAILVDDYFHFEYITTSAFFPLIDAMIFTTRHTKYAIEFKKYKIVKTLTSYINNDIFQDRKLPKKYDILLYGTYDVYLEKSTYGPPIYDYFREYGIESPPFEYDFYKFRTRLFRLIKNTPRYNVYHIEKSALGGNKCPVRTVQLSNLINQSYLAVATSSIIDKMMTKYWEILASGTIILGSIPSDYRTELKPWTIEVTDHMSDEQILSIIDEALADKKRLELLGHTASGNTISLYGNKNIACYNNFASDLVDIVNEIHNKSSANT
jgi:hypothetical protein